ALVRELNLLLFKHPAVLIAQHRQQHFVIQILFGRVPVYVEKGGEGRARPVFEDVVPPLIARAGNAHVVGDDVHHEPQAVPFERAGELVEVIPRPQFGVELCVVGHVITVQAARSRRQQRRGVTVTDAQFVQVACQRCRLPEGEMVIELPAVSRSRNAGVNCRRTFGHYPVQLFWETFEEFSFGGPERARFNSRGCNPRTPGGMNFNPERVVVVECDLRPLAGAGMPVALSPWVAPTAIESVPCGDGKGIMLVTFQSASELETTARIRGRPGVRPAGTRPAPRGPLQPARGFRSAPGGFQSRAATCRNARGPAASRRPL